MKTFSEKNFRLANRSANPGKSSIAPKRKASSVWGRFGGRTLHELWFDHHSDIFGEQVADAPRFPLLVKLLDARDRLSLQVHPPPEIAHLLGGEAKSEMWYFVAAEAGAEIYAGLRHGVERAQFEQALKNGAAADLVHRLEVKTGDAFFIPSGRLHAIGAGNLSSRFSRIAMPPTGSSIGAAQTSTVAGVGCKSRRRCNRLTSTISSPS